MAVHAAHLGCGVLLGQLLAALRQRGHLRLERLRVAAGGEGAQEAGAQLLQVGLQRAARLLARLPFVWRGREPRCIGVSRDVMVPQVQSSPTVHPSSTPSIVRYMNQPRQQRTAAMPRWEVISCMQLQYLR